MATSIGYVQAVVAYTSSESANRTSMAPRRWPMSRNALAVPPRPPASRWTAGRAITRALSSTLSMNCGRARDSWSISVPSPIRRSRCAMPSPRFPVPSSRSTFPMFTHGKHFAICRMSRPSPSRSSRAAGPEATSSPSRRSPTGWRGRSPHPEPRATRGAPPRVVGGDGATMRLVGRRPIPLVQSSTKDYLTRQYELGWRRDPLQRARPLESC